MTSVVDAQIAAATSIMRSPISASAEGRLNRSEKTSTRPRKATSKPANLRTVSCSPRRKWPATSTMNGMVFMISVPRASVV